MKRQKITFLVSVTLLSICLTSQAMADWKEAQSAIFQQLQVKPGDVIDSSNWEKINDILPSSVVKWVKRGDFIMNIEEFKWDYSPDLAWQQKTLANAGKYDVGPEGEFIVKDTGEPPLYVDGDPFPTIDIKKDPNAAVKIVYNAFFKSSRVGNLRQEFVVDWIGRNGLERQVTGEWLMRYYWMRPDGPVDNPSKFLVTEFTKVNTPYDLAGILSLNQTAIANTPNQVYSYVPAIRRVKKVSGTTRSSPFLGSDLVNDDAQGFGGKIESMNWKVIDRKIILLPFVKWGMSDPAQFTEQPNGSWSASGNLRGPRIGYEVKDWKGAPWAPVDYAWVPRNVYIVEATPKDPYYNYGRMIYYIDEVAGFSWKVIYDKSDDYWKTLVVSMVPAKWGSDHKISFSSPVASLVVDDKTDHATISYSFGSYGQHKCNVFYSDPTVSSNIFNPTALPSLSK